MKCQWHELWQMGSNGLGISMKQYESSENRSATRRIHFCRTCDCNNCNKSLHPVMTLSDWICDLLCHVHLFRLTRPGSVCQVTLHHFAWSSHEPACGTDLGALSRLHWCEIAFARIWDTCSCKGKPGIEWRVAGSVSRHFVAWRHQAGTRKRKWNAFRSSLRTWFKQLVHLPYLCHTLPHLASTLVGSWQVYADVMPPRSTCSCRHWNDWSDWRDSDRQQQHCSLRRKQELAPTCLSRTPDHFCSRL